MLVLHDVEELNAPEAASGQIVSVNGATVVLGPLMTFYPIIMFPVK